eukprot:Rmarinus@m.21496
MVVGFLNHTHILLQKKGACYCPCEVKRKHTSSNLYRNNVLSKPSGEPTIGFLVLDELLEANWIPNNSNCIVVSEYESILQNLEEWWHPHTAGRRLVYVNDQFIPDLSEVSGLSPCQGAYVDFPSTSPNLRRGIVTQQPTFKKSNTHASLGASLTYEGYGSIFRQVMKNASVLKDFHPSRYIFIEENISHDTDHMTLSFTMDSKTKPWVQVMYLLCPGPNISHQGKQGLVAAPKLNVRVAPGAKAGLVETVIPLDDDLSAERLGTSFSGSADMVWFNGLTEGVVGERASLTHIRAFIGRESTSRCRYFVTGANCFNLSPHSSYMLNKVASGLDLLHEDTLLNIEERAHAKMDGINVATSFGIGEPLEFTGCLKDGARQQIQTEGPQSFVPPSKNRQHVPSRSSRIQAQTHSGSLIVHSGAESSLRHEERCCARGSGCQASFSGKVIVRENAQHTDAQQYVRGLMLNDGSRVELSPAMEILVDEVQCSHGATLAQIDEDMVDYLRSRGIQDALAREILLQGFVSSLLPQNIGTLEQCFSRSLIV